MGMKNEFAPASTAREFDVLVDEVVTTTLCQVIGEEPAKALLYHVGIKASVTGAQAFAVGIERVTGGGALVIEKMMIKALYSRIGMKYEEGPVAFSFHDSLRKASDLFANGGSRL